MTPGRRRDTPTDVSTVMVAHRLLLSVLRSSSGNDWHVLSLMLSFHGLRGLRLQRLPSIDPVV